MIQSVIGKLDNDRRIWVSGYETVQYGFLYIITYWQNRYVLFEKIQTKKPQMN